MGNAEGKRRDVTVDLTVRDHAIGVLYRENITNMLDTPVLALVEIPMDDAIITDWKVKVGDRRIVSALAERTRRTFVLSGDAQEEMLVHELGELPAKGSASLRLRAISHVTRVDPRRVSIRVPRKTIGDDVASISVRVEAAFSRPVAAVVCASHPGMRVSEGASPGEKRVLWKAERGWAVSGQDFECIFEFESEFVADAVVETAPDGTRVCMLVLSMQRADLRLGSVVWPKSFGTVMQIPDQPRELSAADHAVMYAILDGEPSESDYVVFRGLTTTGGIPYVLKAPIKLTRGSVVHKLAAKEEISYLMSGASAGTPQFWSEEKHSWAIRAAAGPVNPGDLRRRVIALGIRHQVTSQYTAFAAEEYVKGVGLRKPLPCRHLGSPSVRTQAAEKDEQQLYGSPSVPKSHTLASGFLGVAHSVRKELKKQGREEVAEHLVEHEGRIMKDVPLPETRRLDTSMLFAGENGVPSISMLKKYFSKEGRLSNNAALRLIREAGAIMSREPNLVEVQSPATVCGDIHGQFFDLLTIFKAGGMPSAINKFIFLGDYVDRGDFSTEVLLFLLALKIVSPDGLVLLRGNHEARYISRTMTFQIECEYKYSDEVYAAFEALYDTFPLAAIVRDTTCGDCLCVHAGIGPSIHQVSDILKINRFQEVPSEGIMCDLLWSDPVGELREFGRMPRSQWESLEFIENKARRISYCYGPKAVERFLRENNLGCIIRGHQVHKEGYMEHFLKDENEIAPVLTIFSAPNYADRYGNKGAFLRLSKENFRIRRIQEAVHPYCLPGYTDALSYTLPLITENLAEVLRALMRHMLETSKMSFEEIKADEALAEKVKRLHTKSRRVQEQRESYLKVLEPGYHKNMSLFERVRHLDEANEARPASVDIDSPLPRRPIAPPAAGATAPNAS